MGPSALCYFSRRATFPRNTETEAFGNVKNDSVLAEMVVATGGLLGSG